MARVLFAVEIDEDMAQTLLDHLSTYKNGQDPKIALYTPHPEEMEFCPKDEDHNLDGCTLMTLLQMDVAYGEIDTEFDDLDK